LISIPFQGNYNTRINLTESGHQSYLNIQPVIPFHVSTEWNVISRTILPVVDQVNIIAGSGSQFGLSDTLQSLFLSPTQPTNNGVIWGVGPALQIPTATQTLLGTGKVDLGPTGVALKMIEQWTVGILANQLWSIAGDDQRSATSTTFVQPFLSYTTSSAWTYSLNSESTYDWTESTLSAPINATLTKVIKLGKQRISIGGGVRYWVASPDTGPKGFGARFIVTLLFPKSS
jgi:hypothetical protein